MTPGIDVSSENGAIDWAAVAASGVRFAYIRALYASRDGGIHKDARFRENVLGCIGAGILPGGYGFARPAADARQQSFDLSDACGQLVLPPALDFEILDGRKPEELVHWGCDFISALEAATKRRCVVYTGAFTLGEVAQQSGLTSSPLWLAQYTMVSAPWVMPPGWDAWTFWQHLGNKTDDFPHEGRCPGVATPCDLDRFAGTFEDLERFCANSWKVQL